MNIKVRFAPSPTGFLHIGNIRIAILNYLFIKKNGGSFVLRIDDTDTERSTQEFEELILEDLNWLGIDYNEFYKQSDHINHYNEAFKYLQSIGRVYPCYESKEELILKRKLQTKRSIPPIYDRAALKLTASQIEQFERERRTPYWRFKLNESRVISWNDMVHGDISIPLNTISDPVLVKPDGSFVYTFASVVDDANIGITHIIRGDDHITNTAAQIDLFEALGAKVPCFAHIPLISSIDGQDISKRTGSTLSIINIRKQGILPEAIWNVLSALGTAYSIDYRETLDDLIQKFSFEKMSLSSPKFNIEDVRLVSNKIIAEKSFEAVKPQLDNLGLENISEYFWDTVKYNIDSVKDVTFWYNIFYSDAIENNIIDDKQFVHQMLETLNENTDFDTWVSQLKIVSCRKGRDLFHPMRIVLTGLENGPELKKIFNILGYERVRNRIERSLDK